jgi:hypothetical protein
MAESPTALASKIKGARGSMVVALGSRTLFGRAGPG